MQKFFGFSRFSDHRDFFRDFLKFPGIRDFFLSLGIFLNFGIFISGIRNFLSSGYPVDFLWDGISRQKANSDLIPGILTIKNY